LKTRILDEGRYKTNTVYLISCIIIEIEIVLKLRADDDDLSWDESSDKEPDYSKEKVVSKIEGPGNKVALVIKCARCFEKRIIGKYEGRLFF
jgi:hypothetical protein